MISFKIVYFALKFGFFLALVRSFVTYEALHKHFLALSVLYTVVVAGLSYAFLLSWQPVVDWAAWGKWLGLTLLISSVYFWLLARYEDGVIFWILLLAGVGVCLF